ncbi:thiamine pyrophosphokinase [Colletotrichum musicola]|uniref:Thiamine pyrophosphokinase n=1 Tax=Colletotrichum musicola TaxID=2175873 RepID=A0A8H6KMR3_9PEZI|nr:thiamine pyrophosphokinase [Colletotrichum musicola]
MASFEWRPVSLLRERQQQGSKPEDFALVVLHQPLRRSQVFDTLWDNAITRVAADGGANQLHDLTKLVEAQSNETRYTDIDVIIGDLDSLLPSVEEYYSSLAKPPRIIRKPDQDSPDFHKAVTWVRSNHAAKDIVAIGGLGGRVDQGMSQLHHLYVFQPGPAYDQGRLYLVSSQNLTFLLLPGRHRIRVREDDGGADVFGKHVGIIPVGGASFITTKGLEWDVENWETKFGGHVSTSNHVLHETRVVEVETTNAVIFTIALAGLQ